MAVEHIPFTQARAQLADLIGRVGYGGERVVLTRHGRPAAALVPIADLERLAALEDAERDTGIPRLGDGSFERSGQAGGGAVRRLDVAARTDGGPALH